VGSPQWAVGSGQFGSLAVWQFGSLAVWRFGGLAVWQFGGLAVWRFAKARAYGAVGDVET